MGYDLHVTRAPSWDDNTGREIHAEEWLDVVRRDPELEPDPDMGPCAALWTGSRTRAWFDWSDGNVYTTNPDRPTVEKLIRIATTLRASVQGDDGETYEKAEQWQES